ncbi:MAG: ELM1/GtrOC1 family putative glycosyltransferase [Sulfurospirillaceae bacterium]|nr:ELM1/GtrOC1 family putative glycosyltransferase [Sulfurospirillaceae bacterium]MDD2826322.1 ELM1/GtrOC1 family putative glycosyltransferase [Sulfurospirillaceae bacterium]
MTILILSDGRAGHVNQSIAFAKHLHATYEVISIKYSCQAYKMLSYLLDKLYFYTACIFKYDMPQKDNYDVIVCAGSTTYYAAKVLARRMHTPAITMMLPKGYRYDFDTIFAQMHDNPPLQHNIIPLPANFSYVEPKGLFVPKSKSVGLIIGGNNALFTMDKARMKSQLDFIFTHFADYEIAVTTSPRTPKEIESLVESYPFAYSVIFSQNKMNPIADFLHHCEVVFITMDSTSMISEAISYGASCIEILPLDNTQNTKFYTMVQTLEREGYLHIFNDSVALNNRKINFETYAQRLNV